MGEVIPQSAARSDRGDAPGVLAGVCFCLMNLAYNIGDDSTDEEQGVLESRAGRRSAKRTQVRGSRSHAVRRRRPIVEPPTIRPTMTPRSPIAKDIGRLIAGNCLTGGASRCCCYVRPRRDDVSLEQRPL